MNNMEDNIVIVINADNYIQPEKCPFKAKVLQKYDDTLWVRSLVTDKEYELYYDQVLEYCNIEEINKIINLVNYGK